MTDKIDEPLPIQDPELDSQSTMDRIAASALISETFRSLPDRLPVHNTFRRPAGFDEEGFD